MKPFLYSLKIWLTSPLAGSGMIYFAGKLTDDSNMTFEDLHISPA
jgi:hypothetical protein